MNLNRKSFQAAPKAAGWKRAYLPYWLVCLLLIWTSGACTFEPEENFVQVSPAPTVQIKGASLQSVDLLQLPDTFALLARSTDLTYSFSIENQDSVMVNVLVDQKRIYQIPAAQGRFSIYAPSLAEGYHKLSLEVITNSGTGSLADRLGAEQLGWQTREWTFSYTRVVPLPVAILSARPIEGRLRVEWAQSEVLTEKILEFEYLPPNDFPIKWSYSVKDPHQLWLDDSLFVEGKVNITLTSVAIDPRDPSPTTSLSILYPYPNVKQYSSNGQGHLTMYWQKSLFYRNVAGYRIEFDDKAIVRSTSGLDSVGTTNQIPFFQAETVVFRTLSKHLANSYGDTIKLRTTAQVLVGQRHNSWLRYFVHSFVQPQHGFNADYGQKKFFVLRQDSAVSTFPMGSIAILTSSQMAASSGGEYLYFGYDSKISRLDRSGNIVMLVDMAQLSGKKLALSNLSLSQDRYLCFTSQPYNTYTDRVLWMYDLLEQKFTISKPSQDAYEQTYSTEQTPDGQYLIVHHPFRVEVHRLVNGGIASTKEFKDSYDGVFVNTALDNKIILINNPSEIILYDPLTDISLKKTLNTLDLPYTSSYQYDRVTGYVGTEYGDHFYVIDPSSGQVLRKILVRKNTNTFRLYNGHLYAYERKLDLKLNQ